MAVQGVEEIVGEAVEGSIRIVRCISYGVMVLAAIAVVRIGLFVLAVLSKWTSNVRRPCRRNLSDIKADAFGRQHGGRLLGEGKQPSASVTVRQLGLFDQFETTLPEDGVDRYRRVDPNRVSVGDTFSFIYSRGNRAGRRKTVKLIETLALPEGTQLHCS